MILIFSKSSMFFSQASLVLTLLLPKTCHNHLLGLNPQNIIHSEKGIRQIYRQ